MTEGLAFLANGSYSLVSFIVALSIIVFIHEFGHYIVGRWCGIKAEVFSIGFGPVLISKNDKHGTMWQIALLPLGGFVKFSGDETNSQANKENLNDKGHTFDEASVLARTLTVIAGPFANFILTFLILIFFVLINGVSSEKVQIDKVNNYPFVSQNFRANDIILSINDQITPDLNAFYGLLSDHTLNKEVKYTIERDGIEQTVIGPHPFQAIVGSVSLRSAASASGLKEGDLIVKVNEVEIFSFLQLQRVVFDNNNYPLMLNIWRDGEVFDIFVTPKVVDYPDSNGGFVKRKLIGITGGFFFEFKKEKANLFEASKISINQIVSIISGSLSGIKNILIGAISTCNLQGPIGIASTAGEAAQQGIASFIWIIAVLSTAIGMLNLFPIPMLDGGHLVFFGIESLTRKKPSEKFKKGFSFVGLSILIMLMLTAISSDLFCP
jgi:regulator of sigma E protease